MRFKCNWKHKKNLKLCGKLCSTSSVIQFSVQATALILPWGYACKEHQVCIRMDQVFPVQDLYLELLLPWNKPDEGRMLRTEEGLFSDGFLNIDNNFGCR